MFRVKICGIRSVDDALAAAEAGADAIGLNFCPTSRRYLTEETALQIVQALPPGIIKVGVFVDAPSTEVIRLFDQLGLDFVQLHGSEPPEFVAALLPRPVVWACRVEATGLGNAASYVAACDALGVMPRVVLVDACHHGQFGGTGQTVDWSLCRAERPHLAGLPMVLAGGLTPENVAEGIRMAQPDAVDVASGVEGVDAMKDKAKLQAFVNSAKAAFAAKSRQAIS